MYDGEVESEKENSKKLNFLNENDDNSNKIHDKNNIDKFSYLPNFLRNIALNKQNKTSKLNSENIVDILEEDKKENNFIKLDSFKEIDNPFYNQFDIEQNYDDNSNHHFSNKYKEFFKNNFSNMNKDTLLPIINEDNIDSYMKKLSKIKQKNPKTSPNLFINREAYKFLNLKYNSFNHTNSTASSNSAKIKIMKPKIEENFEKLEDEIQKKHQVKFENFEPRECLKEYEKKLNDIKYKFKKLDSNLDSSLLNKNDKKFELIEKIKNETALNDSQILYNEILELKEFVESFHNKIKFNLIPEKNFSKNIFNFEKDFYENIAHRIKSISKPAELDIDMMSGDLGSTIIQTSQNLESFLTQSPESSYVYTDGSIITEILETEKNVLKFKNFNFKIKREFNDKFKLKEKHKNIDINNTLKFLRKNLKMVKSVQSRMGTTIGKMLLSNSNEINESFVNSSFLVENNQPDEIQIRKNLRNFEDRHYKTFSKNFEENQRIKRKDSKIMEEIMKINKSNNLYTELEKKMQRKNRNNI